MESRVGVVGVLLLLPLIALAQTAEQPIKSGTELASALVQRDEQSRVALLESFPQLIDNRLWEDVTRRAAAAYYQESPARAIEIYGVSILVATKLRDTKLLAKTYYNLARTYSGVNQPDKAIESYERSREYFEQAGLRRDLIYVLADMGALYFNKENYQKAKDFSELSISIADSVKNSDIPAAAYPSDFGRARALHTLAEIDLRNGNHENAIEKLNRAVSLYQALNDQGSNYTYYLAGVYAALGKVYPEIGDYTRALLNLDKALELANATRDQDTIANILNSVGYLYLEQEDYPQAKEYFDRSLKAYLVTKNDVEASRVLLNLGVVEQRQGHYDPALAQFNLSLSSAKASQNTDVQIAAGEGIGVVLTAKRNLTEALVILNESLATAKQAGNKTREIELTWRSAQTLYEMANYGEASTRGEAASSLARSAHLPKLEYLATTTLGQVYAAQGKLELAKETLIRATQQLERLREQVAGRETAAQLYFENKLASYQALVDILVRQDKPNEALVYAERAKARVLLDVVSSNRSNVSKGLSPAERDKQLRLNGKISEINARLRSSQSSASARDLLYDELDAARLEYQAFQDSVYAAHPDLKLRTGRTASLSNTDIADLTKNNETAYLQYVVSKGQVYLFVVGRNSGIKDPSVSVYTLASKPDELAKKVDLFHNRIANRHPDFGSIATELYKALIEPAAEHLHGINTICIIPDGFLWNLPYQALITGNDRYLVEDHALFYTPSLSVLREMSKERLGNQKKDDSLIAFGNPVIGKDEQRNEELCPLPEAETEVNSIAKSFGPKVRRRVFIGREALEKSFRVLAPSYATIHLATHGVLDNRQPLYSHLLLTKTEGDVENDGLLEAREIMNINLKADLAVLSACETANGRIAPGEGVMGMSWAFFIAGARSMLVSQWKVNSASTSQLMVNFYQSLEANRRDSKTNRPEALRDAARKSMKNASFRHPFYWAGFVMIGNGM